MTIALGSSDSSLRGWARELDIQGTATYPGHGRQGLSAEQAESKRLQRELEIARPERDVLNNAVASLVKV